MTIRAVEPKAEPFLPSTLQQAVASAIPAIDATPLHRLIVLYGYELRPRDFLGRIVVTTAVKERPYYFFRIEKIIDLFAKVEAYAQNDSDRAVMRSCINAAALTTYLLRNVQVVGEITPEPFSEYTVYDGFTRTADRRLNLNDLCHDFHIKNPRIVTADISRITEIKSYLERLGTPALKPKNEHEPFYFCVPIEREDLAPYKPLYKITHGTHLSLLPPDQPLPPLPAHPENIADDECCLITCLRTLLTYLTELFCCLFICRDSQ